MRKVKKYGWIGAGLYVGFIVISGLVPAQENKQIKELQITQADVQLLNRIRQCRPADLSDAMDDVGLIGTGSMSLEMQTDPPGDQVRRFCLYCELCPCEKKRERMQGIGGISQRTWCLGQRGLCLNKRAPEGRQHCLCS